MTEKIRKVLSFPSPVPAKADYQRVKSSYSVREIKQLFGLSERTVRRWTEAGIIHGTPAGETGISNLVFFATTPALLFRAMATTALPTLPDLAVMAAYFGPCLLLYGGWAIGRSSMSRGGLAAASHPSQVSDRLRRVSEARRPVIEARSRTRDAQSDPGWGTRRRRWSRHVAWLTNRSGREGP